jgi:hypothetical protein
MSLPAQHARELNVGEEDINLLSRLQEKDRCLGGTRFENCAARFAKRERDALSYECFVFDDQYHAQVLATVHRSVAKVLFEMVNSTNRPSFRKSVRFLHLVHQLASVHKNAARPSIRSRTPAILCVALMRGVCQHMPSARSSGQ